MNNEFTCEMCHGTFEKGWTDEEAEAELKQLFAPVPAEECGLICDDCFLKLDLPS